MIKEKSEIYDIIYRHELNNDVVVSVIFIKENEIDKKRKRPFVKNITREGIEIWSRG